MLETGSGIKKVHVLAHSMGNLVVLDALSTYSQTANPVKVGQLIMAAPDVTIDQYKQVIPGVAKVTAGMTLYASSADKAMAASKVWAEPEGGRHDGWEADPSLRG